MEATTTKRRRKVHSITKAWDIAKDLDYSQKMQLVAMLVSSARTADDVDKKKTADDFAGAWADMDDDMLDAALAKFHKDWGGEEDAMTIAEELRSSRGNSRTVETW